MNCPQCKREYRRLDFSRDETYFECDDCSVELEGAPFAGDSPSVVASRLSGEPGAKGSFSYSTLNIGVAGPGQLVVTPIEIARGYDASIIVRRWFARVVDMIVLFIVYLAVVMSAEQLGVPDGVVGLVVLLLWLGYFIAFEALTGRTPGKAFVGLRVVDSRGEVPGFKKALIRALLSLLEVNPLLFGGIPAAIVVFASASRQRLGDMAAGTFVLLDADMPRILRP
jgi:uncharacterized RDD family membrane protein YckC